MVAENHSGMYYTGSMAVISRMILKASETNNAGNMRFTVMRNPANDFVNISSSRADGDLVEFLVYDVFGSVVIKDTFTNNISLDISALSPGIYMVFLRTTASYEVECLIKK